MLFQRNWSEHEIELLKKIYHTASTKELRQYFPRRSIGAILGKASALGLKKK